MTAVGSIGRLAFPSLALPAPPKTPAAGAGSLLATAINASEPQTRHQRHNTNDTPPPPARDLNPKRYTTIPWDQQIGIDQCVFLHRPSMAAPLDTQTLGLVFQSRPDILAGIQKAAGRRRRSLLSPCTGT